MRHPPPGACGGLSTWWHGAVLTEVAEHPADWRKNQLRPLPSCFQLSQFLHLTLSQELCWEYRPLLFQPRLQAQEAGPGHWEGGGGLAGTECLLGHYAYRGLRDKALSKEFSPEKLNLKPRDAAAHSLSRRRGLPVLLPPTLFGAIHHHHQQKNLRKSWASHPFSVPIKLTNMQNLRLVCAQARNVLCKSTHTYICFPLPKRGS